MVGRGVLEELGPPTLALIFTFHFCYNWDKSNDMSWKEHVTVLEGSGTHGLGLESGPVNHHPSQSQRTALQTTHKTCTF